MNEATTTRTGEQAGIQVYGMFYGGDAEEAVYHRRVSERRYRSSQARRRIYEDEMNSIIDTQAVKIRQLQLEVDHLQAELEVYHAESKSQPSGKAVPNF